MLSIDRLTLPVFEAAVVGCIRSSVQTEGSEIKLSDETVRETKALVELCRQSQAVQEILKGMLDFLEHSEVSLEDKLDYLFRQSFIFGWHARGAIEEDDHLQQLMH